MSYYNLPPTKYATEQSPLEKALRSLPMHGAIEALSLLEKITRNVVHSPCEDKFRRFRKTNEKMAPLTNLPGSSEILSLMGWVEDGDVVILPSNIKLDFQLHVVKILEAKDYFSEAKEKQKVASRRVVDPNKAEVLHQLELDRQERLAAQSTQLSTSDGVATLHQLEVDRQERMASQNSSPTPQPSPQPKRSPLAVLGAAAAANVSQTSLPSPPGSPMNGSGEQCEDSKFVTGEIAEVAIIEGIGAGNWVSCKILGPGSVAAAESYEIYILPTSDYNNVGGFSGKNIPDMSVQYLRKACWTCSQCTLINTVSSTQCRACGAPSPAHDQPRGSSRACGDCIIC